jgi:Ca-activated chloride channel family protein
LYDGEPLNVVLKSSSLPHAVTIQGLVGSTPWKMALSLKEKEPREGLSVYWARQKIASIIDQQRFGQDDTAIRKAVLDVALPHHLVSKYTSLIAVDITPVRPAEQTLQTHAPKTNLPEGQEYHAIFGMPNTATSGSMQILIGLTMLALACLVWGYRKQVA